MNVKRFALGAFWTNGYLISDRHGNAVFIDPAAETDIIMDWIKVNKLELKAILLTHGHIDHTAGMEDRSFRDMVAGEIYINKRDSEMVLNPKKEINQRLGFIFSGISAYKNLEDGDELSFGEIKVKVIATPGHTEGSVCLLIGEREGQTALFSGDTLFAQSVGRTDLPGGNYSALVESLVKLSSLPPELVVFPGHGPGTTLFDEMRKNPFWPR
ncbi:MAG: MBL fold metallo-hydrolase [Synergistaceae bacterium]|nr:MBL fold metallo-hydrolase [Synergistaceae bacterium]